MRKEFLAFEWLFLLVGLVLLYQGSFYFSMFAWMYWGYYFIFTVGLSLLIANRHRQRYKKKDIIVFHTKNEDESNKGFIIKGFQLFLIVALLIIYEGNEWVYIPVVLTFVFFIYQLKKYGQQKIVFQYPAVYNDGLFFDKLDISNFKLYEDGVLLETDKNIPVKFSDLDENSFDWHTEFVENDVLDDVLLKGDSAEIRKLFLDEVTQYAEKMRIPITKMEGLLTKS
ncbi:MAG: hypothetical protein ACPG5P_01330 [Saprospiraceae bacterium]